MLTATVPALAADLPDPFAPLIANDSLLCFGRDYSPGHLAQHPKQTTKSILIAFQEEGRVNIVLTPRAGAARQIPASCIWWDRAGIDTSGRKMFPGFSKTTAFACLVPVGNTDQEGGSLLIDPAQDAKSLTLFLQSPISVAEGKQGQATPYFLELGPEDLTFALTRIDPKACAPFRR